MSERMYQPLCPQGTPEAVRRKYNIGDVFLNQAKCLKCGDVIRSHNRHDFVTCSCGNLSVDGGSWCARRVYRDGWETVKDMIEGYDDV